MMKVRLSHLCCSVERASWNSTGEKNFRWGKLLVGVSNDLPSSPLYVHRCSSLPLIKMRCARVLAATTLLLALRQGPSRHEAAADPRLEVSAGVCESWWEPIPPDELAFYWPGPCARCHLTAASDAEVASQCGSCTIDSPGFLEGFDAPLRRCSLTMPPARLRASLRRRMVGSPKGHSYVRELVAALKGRTIHWFGDSMSKQFFAFLQLRAREVGAVVDPVTDPSSSSSSSTAGGSGSFMAWVEEKHGASVYDHLPDDPTGELSKVRLRIGSSLGHLFSF